MSTNDTFTISDPAPEPARPAAPSIPLTHPDFKYVPAAETDVRKTFERVRARMAAEQQTKD